MASRATILRIPAIAIDYGINRLPKGADSGAGRMPQQAQVVVKLVFSPPGLKLRPP